MPQTGKIGDILDFAFNGHSIIVLAGGVFIIYTAIKEIWHMIGINDLSHDVEQGLLNYQNKSLKSTWMFVYAHYGFHCKYHDMITDAKKRKAKLTLYNSQI